MFVAAVYVRRSQRKANESISLDSSSSTLVERRYIRFIRLGKSKQQTSRG
jgi:hypothetical protein